MTRRTVECKPLDLETRICVARDSETAAPNGSIESPDSPGRSSRPVLESYAQLRQPLPDNVGLPEQHLLRRVGLVGDLLGLRPEVVPQLDHEVHEPGDELVVAAQAGRLRALEE